MLTDRDVLAADAIRRLTKPNGKPLFTIHEIADKYLRCNASTLKSRLQRIKRTQAASTRAARERENASGARRSERDQRVENTELVSRDPSVDAQARRLDTRYRECVRRLHSDAAPTHVQQLDQSIVKRAVVRVRACQDTVSRDFTTITTPGDSRGEHSDDLDLQLLEDDTDDQEPSSSSLRTTHRAAPLPPLRSSMASAAQLPLVALSPRLLPAAMWSSVDALYVEQHRQQLVECCLYTVELTASAADVQLLSSPR